MPSSVTQTGDLARRFQWLAGRLVPLFDRLDRVFARDGVWWPCVSGLIVLQLALIARHSPWLDEWQALQIAVQSPTVSDLLANLRYEGHPPLWYAILRGLAAVLGNPMLALPVAAAMLAAIVQPAILFASPFRRLDRLMIAASEFVLFEFLTLSRSMTLGVACVVLAVALWRRGQWSWLFIAILPLCDFLFGVLSLALAFLRWRERKAPWPMIGLWGAMGAVSAWTVRPAADIVPALPLKGIVIDMSMWIMGIGTVGLPLQMRDPMMYSEWGLSWNQPPPLVIGALAAIAFLALCTNEVWKRRDEAIVLGGFLLLTLMFSLAVYPLAIRHLMLAALLLIALTWRRLGNAGSGPSVWMRTWLLLAACCGLLVGAINLVVPFDTAPAAARKIRELGLVERNWYAFPESSGQGIAAINTMTFERSSSRCTLDFVRCNHATAKNIKRPEDLFADLRGKIDRDGKFYLLSDFWFEDRPPFLRRIAAIPRGYDGQAFNIYVIGEDHPDSRARLSRCNGPVRALSRL